MFHRSNSFRKCWSYRPLVAGDRASYFFFFGVAFLAGVFFAAFFAGAFLVLAFALLLPVGSASGGSTFFFLGAFFSSTGALNFCPSKAISVMRTAVKSCLCPRIFLYCFLRFRWNTRIFLWRSSFLT